MYIINYLASYGQRKVFEKLLLPPQPEKGAKPVSEKKRKLQEFSLFSPTRLARGCWMEGKEIEFILALWPIVFSIFKILMNQPSISESSWNSTPGETWGVAPRHFGWAKVGRRNKREKVSLSRGGTWPMDGKCINGYGNEGLRTKTWEMPPTRTKTWLSPAIFRVLGIWLGRNGRMRF